MNLFLPGVLSFMAANLAVTSALAQAATAPGANGASDAGRGLLGDIPGFAAAAASSPASAAAPVPEAASGGLAPGETVIAPARPVPAKSKPQVAPPASSPVEAADARSGPDVERAVFQLTPVRVVLPIDQERIVSLPGNFALHAPEGFDTLVQSQIIERTAYLKALAPFGSLRVVAEDLTTGRQIPLDLVSAPKGKTPLRPMEVFVPTRHARADREDAEGGAGRRDAPALDMVALTRYAAQALYAPRRLIPATPSVRQVPIDPAPVEGLYRGWGVETVPIGAWRSGDLYVTAVRFTNKGGQSIDLELQELRGRWLAATAQHTRLLASDPAWRTTTVYLVCDRPFDACR